MGTLLIVLVGTLVIAVATVGGIVLYAMKNGKELIEAKRELFTTLGYRHADKPDAPIEEQLRIPPKFDLRTRSSEEYLVKPVGQSAIVTFFHRTRQEGRVRVSELDWTYRSGQAPRLLFQVADRSIAGGLGKAAFEAVSGTKRSFRATYPREVSTGNPDWDRRFLVLAQDDAAVGAALRGPDGVALFQALSALAEVDLTVLPDRIVLADPADQNRKAARGGLSGRLTMSLVDQIRVSIPVHQLAFDSLEAAARVAR
jgi:hypothetical protein